MSRRRPFLLALMISALICFFYDEVRIPGGKLSWKRKQRCAINFPDIVEIINPNRLFSTLTHRRYIPTATPFSMYVNICKYKTRAYTF